MIGTLLAHRGAVKVNRDEVERIEPPTGTKSWKPVRHSELITCLGNELSSRGLTIREEAYAVQRSGSVLFGVIDLSWRDTEEFAAALGLRTANDKSMSLQLAVGFRVFVCDNLVFSGDLIALRRKHTSRLDLRKEIRAALDRYQEGLVHLEHDIDEMKARRLEDLCAKAVICDAFRKSILPSRFLRPVSLRYFGANGDKPPAEACTYWRLHNAFTSEIKNMAPGPAFRATIRLGKLFGLGTT